MKRTSININVKNNSVINIVPLFDLHILHPTFDKKLYNDVVSFIRRTPNTYSIFGGDVGEFINFKDKRFDPTHCYPDLKVKDLADIVKKETEVFESMTAPILNSNKCLGMMTGNHDNKLNKDGFGHIIQNLCNKHGLRYLGYSGFIKLLFQKFRSSTFRKFEIFYHHGWHAHSKESLIVDYQTFGGPRKKVGLLCGAFKKGVDWDVETWEESRGYDQNKYNLGTWLIQLRPFPADGGKFDFRYIDLDLKWI